MHERIDRNLAAIRRRMEEAAGRAGRDVSGIALVAVTKSVGLDEIHILRKLGVTHFGENRADIAREKIARVDDASLTWHMVGNIQRRKVKDVVGLFDTIDAIDRISLAEALQRRCEAEGVRCRGLIEVNVSGEPRKHGVAPEALEETLACLGQLDRVRVEGLLTMAPRGMAREGLLGIFGDLRALAESYALPEMSMGMSGDFEEAIEAGATQVRIGRALFD